MKVLKEESSELQIGSSAELLHKSLDSQRELFHSQIDQLQRIVITQCKLTGANPLSQEMAAGALSVKIGKRPRDLLNPKAVKYMQSVFSIKDTVSKKESREISALYGVTVTQVRDFFASQRTRIRRLVRLSREKSTRTIQCRELPDGFPTSSDILLPIDPVPLSTIGPTTVEETPSCSTNDYVLAGIDDLDKQFVENIFGLMRKEETFTGQVKLMEWILRIQNSAVLSWFLGKGGMMILATWLSQAAIEEQTSVLLVVLNVLCHLPLHKALPVHMSAILQSVNRLRFYRTSDISNRARVLLSKWSKLLARSQAMKKPNGVKSSNNVQQQLMLKRSLSEVIGDESWQSSVDTSENILEIPENIRKSEPIQSLKLLPASDDSNKKNILGLSSSQFRERRKVQLVEQPGQRAAGRSPQATRAAPLNQGRPMSADDIQKAKMRAQFMQSKYGRANSSNENREVKTEGLNKHSTSQVSTLSTASKVLVRHNLEEHKKPMTLSLKVPNTTEASLGSKPIIDLESLREKCRRVQISWQTPPEVKLNNQWRVGAGENSKEVEFQKNRNRREKETIYQLLQEIPLNPKEPWDQEMDYDDTLTLEIPTEQLPDAESGGGAAETQVAANHGVNNAAAQDAASQRANGSVLLAPVTSQTGNASTAEPDLELLAVLLKNPELVFALTTGQAANLSSEETVKLLDMIKAGNTSSNNVLNRQVEEKVEVSLPSPTPSSNPGTSGWRPEAVRNPFSRVPLPNRLADNPPAVAATRSVLPVQMSTAHVAPAVPPYSLPQVTSMVPEKYTSLGSSLHQIPLTSPSSVQTDLPPATGPLYNLHAQAASSLRLETATNITPPAPMSNNTFNIEERRHVSFSPTPLPVPSQLQMHQHLLHQQQQFFSEPSLSTPAYSKQIGKPSHEPDSWRPRQSLPSSNYNPLLNQNNGYNHASVGGSDYVEEGEFESWSPNNSPSRNPEYGSGRSFAEPRMNAGRGYRPDQSRVRSSPGYRDLNRHGNRRWRDRRR